MISIRGTDSCKGWDVSRKESPFPFAFSTDRFRRVEPLEAPKGYMTRGMVWTRPHLNPNGDDFRRRGCRWNGRPRGGTKKASRGRQRGERFTLFSDVTTMPAICHWQIFPLVFPRERELSTGSSCISVSILHRIHFQSHPPQICSFFPSPSFLYFVFQHTISRYNKTSIIPISSIHHYEAII